MRVLVVDDEEIKRVSLADDLRDAGFDVADFERGEPALAELSRRHADVVITDLKMPGMDGLELLRRIRAANPETDVIIMTAYGTVETAVQAMRHGAYDYICKPFSSEEALVLLERLQRERLLKQENAALRLAVRDSAEPIDGMVAVSPAMIALTKQIARVAPTDAHVLLVGETGTGKDLIARRIHALSPRKKRPFVKVACATYAEQLVESELFGHERGAYTTADRSQPGRFELADGGTVYLDDVDDIPLTTQTKLLRVIEERVIERVGGVKVVDVDVRIVASTKVDLRERVQAGAFRSDLYHRLNVMRLQVPPLRERREDIDPLFHHFCTHDDDGCLCCISPEARALFAEYRWPGNVRELRNLVERWKILGRSATVQASDLPPEFRGSAECADDHYQTCPRSFEEAVGRLERQLLCDALRKAGGNKTRAAELLGLKPSTFRNKLAQHGLNNR